MRGKHRDGRGQRASARLIPARAGKTPSTWGSPSRSRAHPRACGENARFPARGSNPAGSSPRVRGKHDLHHLRCNPNGLIPARAGKTDSPGPSGWFCWAHPRACGENKHNRYQSIPHAGSSPRVRGKRDAGRHVAAPRRLIPARAGKTTSSSTRRRVSTAHPRACGENFRLICSLFFPTGSSPRVRGKLLTLPVTNRFRGLIPARAGKTCNQVGIKQQPRAHPRACGENRHCVSQLTPALGSSPRVRGKLTTIGIQ